MTDTQSPIRSASDPDVPGLEAASGSEAPASEPVRASEPVVRPLPGSRAAFFLDRDGVLIEEVHYLSDPAQVRLLPGAAAAIARLNQLGVPVVVATNQAGVAHGYFSEAQVAQVHRRLDELLAAQEAFIDRYYYCPHHPDAKLTRYRAECPCRKPSPGMLFQAAAELDLDLERSYLAGDKLSDLEAGLRAGCRVILVLTGYGSSAAQGLDRFDPQSVRVAADLAEAVAGCIPALGDCPETETASRTLCVDSPACTTCRVPVPVSGQPPTGRQEAA